MYTSLTFTDTLGIQHSIMNVRLLLPAGCVAGSGRRFTLWLWDAKHNRYWRYPETFSDLAHAEGMLRRLVENASPPTNGP